MTSSIHEPATLGLRTPAVPGRAPHLAFTRDVDDRLLLDGAELFVRPLQSAIAEFVRLSARPGRHLVMTLNVDQVVTLQHDARFRSAYRSAAMRVLDGMPLVRLAQRLGLPESERNTGADLLPEVCRIAARFGWRVAVVGGAPDVVTSAVANLRARFDGVDVVAVELPMLEDVADPASIEAIDRLEAAHPTISFLCMGSPKQELWFTTWRDRLPDGLYISAGAAVDFAAGSRRRAPRWMQRVGIEWCYRLLQEPRRRRSSDGPRRGVIVAASQRAESRPSPPSGTGGRGRRRWQEVVGRMWRTRVGRLATAALSLALIAGVPVTVSAVAEPPAESTRAVLDTLRVAQPAAASGFDRRVVGAWRDADRNCRDSRAEVLARDSTVAARGCVISSGRWVSAFDGVSTTSAAVQRDPPGGAPTRTTSGTGRLSSPPPRRRSPTGPGATRRSGCRGTGPAPTVRRGSP